ncbi:MAG: TetR/AcrR family transcriptional regulator [Gemmatimonadales bacterium]|jgi:AcrR family transcriptional regulator
MPVAERESEPSRARILEAASAEFGTHGFAGARTARIARAAGVNKQLLFYYFGSKARLYRAVVEHAERRLAQASVRIRGVERTTDRLRRQLEQAFQTLAANPSQLRLVLERASHPDRDAPADGDTVKAILERIRGVVSEGQGLGFFRDDADPDEVARQAVVLVVGYLAVEHALEPDSPAEPRRTDWIAGVCDLVLRALTW